MRRARGFTLLEVLVAVSILGLGLTAILSAQAGLFASSQRVEHFTQSANLLRCKMSEVELELLQMGFPLLDKTERGPCCGDEIGSPYSCEWTIQTIELPQPASFAGEAGGSDAFESGMGAPGMGQGDMGQLANSLGSLTQMGPNASLTDMTESLTQAMPDGGGGLLQMAMNIVFPTLKPMLEASIRKVTVHVRWREGRREQELTAVQYVTNPLEGGLNPNAADFMEALTGGGMGLPGFGEQGSGGPGATSPGAGPTGGPRGGGR